MGEAKVILRFIIKTISLCGNWRLESTIILLK